MKIPILNLYYMVSYASGILKPDRHHIPVGDDDGYELSDLYARLLIDGVDGLLRRGLHRQYVEVEEEIPGIRGQLRFADSIRRKSFRNGRAVCAFDELDVDILPNRILKAAMRRVLASKSLDVQYRAGLRTSIRRMNGVSDIPLSPTTFRPLVMHRNMARYRFLLFIARLVAEHSVISEDGRTAEFFDLERDEAKLARLFEAFVRNFYASESIRYRIGRRSLSWIYVEEGNGRLLPAMETDIPLESDDHIIIIDTKYYASAVTHNSYGQDRFKSANLYQMFAYMRHYPNPRNLPLTGILLYPRNDRDIDVRANRIHPDDTTQPFSEAIYIKTLDLTRPWPGIHTQLMGLLE